MQPDFSQVIQKYADKSGQEMSSKEILSYFQEEYIKSDKPYNLRSFTIHSVNNEQQQKEMRISAVICVSDKVVSFESAGNGPVDAFVHGMKSYFKIEFHLNMYHEHALNQGSDAQAVAYIGIIPNNGKQSYGVGIDENIVLASIKGILSALNRNDKKGNGPHGKDAY